MFRLNIVCALRQSLFNEYAMQTLTTSGFKPARVGAAVGPNVSDLHSVDSGSKLDGSIGCPGREFS
jgi:hypothetical protein